MIIYRHRAELNTALSALKALVFLLWIMKEWFLCWAVTALWDTGRKGRTVSCMKITIEIVVI